MLRVWPSNPATARISGVKILVRSIFTTGAGNALMKPGRSGSHSATQTGKTFGSGPGVRINLKIRSTRRRKDVVYTLGFLHCNRTAAPKTTLVTVACNVAVRQNRPIDDRNTLMIRASQDRQQSVHRDAGPRSTALPLRDAPARPRAIPYTDRLTRKQENYVDSYLWLAGLRQHHGIPGTLQGSHPSGEDPHAQRRVSGPGNAAELRRLRWQHRLHAQETRRQPAADGRGRSRFRSLLRPPR